MFMCYYLRLRQLHVKTRHPTEGKSEAWITEAVVSYDFLHNDTTKPMQAVGLAGLEVDPQFRGIYFTNLKHIFP